MAVKIQLPIEKDLRDPMDIIDDYLDRLIAPLVGTVPHDQRNRLRRETAYHLELEQEDLIALGMDPMAAALQAIQDYGPASEISEAFLVQWFERKAQHPLAKKFGLGNCIAFSCFLMAQFVMVGLFILRVFYPNSDTTITSMSPAEIRKFWPEPLPFPELSWSFFVIMLLPLITPWIAGWFAGQFIPVRARSAVYQGMMPIIIYSMLIAAVLGSFKEALVYALFQIAYWLPVGCITAHISSTMARMKRMRAHDRTSLRSKHSSHSVGGTK